jgi:WD40 repeat protein
MSDRLGVWDVPTGRLERVLVDDYQEAFGITADGRAVVTAGPEGTLEVRDLASGTLTQRLDGHTGELTAIAFSPDGRRLVTGNAAFDAREPIEIVVLVWDLASEKLMYRMPLPRGAGIRGVAVTPDSTCAISVGNGRMAQVWSVETGELRHELSHDHFGVTAVAATSDGRQAITTSGDGAVTIWDLQTGSIVHRFTCPTGITSRVAAYANAIALSRTGSLAIFAMMDATLRVWNLAARRFEQMLTGHGGEVLDVAITPDGSLAVSASRDRTVRLWQPRQRAEVSATGAHDGRVTALALTPRGSRTLSASRDHTIRIWDTKTGVMLSKLAAHTESVNTVLVTPDGQRAVSRSSDLTVKIWNLPSGTEERSLRCGDTLGEWPTERRLVLTHDGKRIVNFATGTIAMLCIASGSIIWKQGADSVDYLAVTPDDRHVLSCSRDVMVLDARTGERRHRLRVAGYTALIVASTPNGRCAVVGYENGSVRLWNLQSGKVAHNFRGHKEVISALAVTDDGRYAVSGDWNGLLKVWDLAAETEHATLSGHTDRVWMLAVAPDSRYCVTAADDHTIRVWNLEAGCQVAALVTEGAVWACAIADSRTIVAGGDSGRVFFLDLIEPKDGQSRRSYQAPVQSQRASESSR